MTELVKYKEVEKEVWDQYVQTFSNATIGYTSVYIDFEEEYSVCLKNNESVIWLVDKKPQAIVIIYLEEQNGKKSISWSRGYVRAPLLNSNMNYQKQEKLLKEILFYIDKIASIHNCKSVSLKFDPLVNPNSEIKIYNYNFLMKEGYRNQTSLTQILDIRMTKEELWSQIRKGHKSDIKKGNYEITIYDQDNITQEVIEEYRRIYELDAGKVTRNSQMYFHYYKFVKAGEGIVAIASKEEKNVAVLIATMYKDTAYYNSYAELTDQLQGIPVGHQLQWNVILDLKHRGVQFYELGEQVFGTYPKGTEEEKLVNISSYKRGFGGYTVPMFRGYKEIDGEN